MKKLVIAFTLAMILTLVLSGSVMADGPGNNGQGADPQGNHPPNEVWVPLNAWQARAVLQGNPPNPDSNGAIFLGGGG